MATDGIYARGRKLWMVLRVASGEWDWQATPFVVGQEAEARRFRAGIQEQLDAGAELRAKGGGTTVEGFAQVFLTKRFVKHPEDDKSLLKTWVYPAIGAMEIAAVRARHIKAVTDAAREKGRAPKTVRNIYAIMQALFREAAVEGLIGENATPCILREAQLGKIQDGEKGWRRQAIFTRAEYQTIISDERVPQDRRVFYGLAGLGCLRSGEAAGLRWGRVYDGEPLGGLSIETTGDTGDTKTGEERQMPIHPVLAAMLAEWKLSGWAREFGRAPTDDDLVVPHTQPTNRGPRVKFMGIRSDHDSYKRLRKDLVALGLRARRVHDFRRTGITLYREDGADPTILHYCTHAPPKDVMGRYTTPPWAHLCGQIAPCSVRRVRGAIDSPLTVLPKSLKS